MNRTGVKISALIVSGIFFAWFYYRYVPLIPAYQAVLAPILVFLLIRTATDARKGLLAFCFIFPLLNCLPYFFGIDERIPHAPAALVAFLAFFMGRMASRIFAPPASPPAAFLPLSLKLLAAWGGVSALITFFRYMDFFPWAAPGIHELKVNVAGLSAGGARMSVVFTSASLLSGIAMFAFFRQALADPSFKIRLVNTLTLSALLSFLFGYFQSFQTVVPGNTPYWNELEQLNATFKDPNSLAAFITGFVPLVIIRSMGQSGFKHALFVLVGGLGLGLLPLSGSRSGMAAITVAGAVFGLGILVGAGKTMRKRAVFHAAGFLLFFIAWNIVAVPHSAMSLRLGWSIYQLKEMKPPADPQVRGGERAPAEPQIQAEGQAPADSEAEEQEDIGDFFNKRLILWSAAGAMFRTAPLTGVGLGAFIVIFPDHLKARGRTNGFTDSALNLAFQIGAETGLVGLVFSLAFLVGLVGRMVGVFRFRVPDSDRDGLGLGAVCGLAAFFFNFMFHTYAASYEIVFVLVFGRACFLPGGPARVAGKAPSSGLLGRPRRRRRPSCREHRLSGRLDRLIFHRRSRRKVWLDAGLRIL